MELTSGAIIDYAEWLQQNLSLIEALFNSLSDFRLKALIYLKINYIKVNHRTGEVIGRMDAYIPSFSATDVIDVDLWLEYQIMGLKLHADEFNKRESDLIFDGIESATFKITLLQNYSGRGSFKLPKTLKDKTAVINVDCDTHCFKYAVLSILHYSEIDKTHSYRKSSYTQWENELKFGDIDPTNMKIKAIETFEKLNEIKVNVHVWEKGLKGVRYNNQSSAYNRVVNVLLVHEDSSQRWHYCGIPKIPRLYSHLKSSKVGGVMYCDRCIRAFYSKDKFETHYEWCKRGKLQIERMPKDKIFSYRDNGEELSPLRVIYADIECYIDENIHKPAAIACYEVWHNSFKHRNKMHVCFCGQRQISVLYFVTCQAFIGIYVDLKGVVGGVKKFLDLYSLGKCISMF